MVPVSAQLYHWPFPAVRVLSFACFVVVVVVFAVVVVVVVFVVVAVGV